jgi:hypothetical protein
MNIEWTKVLDNVWTTQEFQVGGLTVSAILDADRTFEVAVVFFDPRTKLSVEGVRPFDVTEIGAAKDWAETSLEILTEADVAQIREMIAEQDRLSKTQNKQVAGLLAVAA